MVYTEALESPRLFRKRNLELIPRKGSFSCLVPTLMLAPTKADPQIPRGPFRWAVGLEQLASAWRTNPCRTLSLFFGVLGGSWGEDWTSCIAWCGSPLFGGVPMSIWIAVPKREHGGAFLREWEPGAIAAERSLVSSNWASPNGLANPLGMEKLEL